jgi:hypothetical protein
MNQYSPIHLGYSNLRNTTKFALRLAVVAAALLGVSSIASAISIPASLTTLDKPFNGNFQSGAVIFNLTGAMPFITGSSASTLESISVSIQFAPADQSYAVGLYQLSGTVPSGSPVYTDFTLGGSSGGIYSFVADTDFVLQANTGYAFAIKGASQAFWTQTDISSGFTTNDGWTMLGFSQAGGDGFGGNGSWSANDNRFYAAGAIFTSAAAVPEPSSFAALAGLAVLGCASSRRRRPASL